MKIKIAPFFVFIFLFISHQIIAQSTVTFKLEKITTADFNPVSPVVDSNANAVVLADVGNSEFQANSDRTFTLVFNHIKRVLLRKRSSFAVATVKIPIYVGERNEEEERLEAFEATTYNLEKGVIIETSVDKKSLFREKYNSVSTIRKFTFPNIKEGSIIEYKYTIKSPYYGRLRPWLFQDNYPVLWSEYHVAIIPRFNYYFLKQGFLPFVADSSKAIFKEYYDSIAGEAYSQGSVVLFSDYVKFYSWSIKDAPAFKVEAYLSNIINYLPRIQFQLREVTFDNKALSNKTIKTWLSMAKQMLDDPDYTSVLTDKNAWLNNDLKAISNNPNPYEKAKSIYNYVRNNFSCTSHDASVWLSEPLKKIYESKKGTVTNINLLLTAMLAHEGFDVHPVILSTKGNGHVTESAPILEEYNYVIARLKIDTTFYLLDASEDKLGFGKLMENCYNISGRLIDKDPILIPLTPNNLTEEKTTTVFITNGEKGEVSGFYNSNLGYFESLGLREEFTAKKQDELAKDIAKSYPSDIEITNVQLDSFKVYEEPITLHYDMKFNFGGTDIIYLNPLFDDAFNKNPFAAAERLYPVEMQAKMSKSYNLTMDVPKGYTIDELPKSTRVKLDDNQGSFEYIVVASNGTIQLRSKLVLEKAIFLPEEYQTLRDFFAFVVKKQAEQIVFKKIK